MPAMYALNIRFAWQVTSCYWVGYELSVWEPSLGSPGSPGADTGDIEALEDGT